MSGSRRRGRGYFESVDVSVDVGEVLSQVADETIVEEIIERDLQAMVLQRIHGASKAPVPVDAGQRIDEAQQDLMCRRIAQAEAGLVAVIDALVGRDLLAALDLIRAGRIAEAICALERDRRPSPAATATPPLTVRTAAIQQPEGAAP